MQVICSSGEATSLTQNKRFNCESVEAFFEYFKELWSRYNITANRTCNLDETQFSWSCCRIICAKIMKQVGSVASGGREG